MAKINQSNDTEQLGIFSRLDRWCRRILPGYNYIRNKRTGSRIKLHARSSVSGVNVPGKLRRRANRARNSNEAEISDGTADETTDDITDEIYVGAGISKSEFCKKLDDLLRRKLVEMQERLAQVDPEEMDDNQNENDNNINVDVAVAVDVDAAVLEQEEDQSQMVRPEVSPEVRQRMIQAMLHQPGQVNNAQMDTEDINTADKETQNMETQNIETEQENFPQEFQTEEHPGPSNIGQPKKEEDLPSVSPEVRQKMIQVMLHQPAQELRKKGTRNKDNPQKTPHEKNTCLEEPLSKKPRKEEPQPFAMNPPNIQTENEVLPNDNIEMDGEPNPNPNPSVDN